MLPLRWEAMFEARRLPRYGAIILCATILLIATSQYGIGFSSASFSYLSGADSLREEGILTQDYWLVHFPPLQPLVLMLLATNLTLILTLNTVLLCANLMLVGYALEQLDVAEFYIIGTIIGLGSLPIMALMHGIIYGEPLFLILVQLSLLLLWKERLGWAAVMIALAPLQHYVGVALIVVGVLVVWQRYGFRAGLSYGALTAAPITVWTFRNYLILDESARTISLSFMTIADLWEGVVNIAPWLFPVSGFALGAFLLNRRWPSLSPLVRLYSLFIILYLIVLVVSGTLFDHFTSLDFHILSPVIMLGWVIAIWGFHTQLPLLSPSLKVAGRYTFSLLMAAYLVVGLGYAIVDLRPKGLGLIRATRPVYEDVLQALPDDSIIYSNHIWLVNMLGYSARNLPFTRNLSSLQAMAAYDEQMNVVINQIYDGNAVILWFEEFRKSNLVSLEELQAFLPYEEYDGLLIFSVGLSSELSLR